ncbi:MAG: glycosyltransferase family 39 protein [Candidatus Omnitrophica bacterium]|nr:glycosyltransferase family 39 protein [Candidatus Omnitrophota bacterium]MDD5553966.1 glycosyltransferase family 39 protein [Candidatus Omnitrophota bacterium]
MPKGKALAALFLIAIAGFFLRSYNLDFPSIGYHNTKENEYLGMAQEMMRTGEFFPSISYYNIEETGYLSTSPEEGDSKDFITRRIYFYNAFDESPKMKLYPQPPLVSYQILFSWKLFGENLWGARLFNIVFGVLAIFVIYFLGLLLFKDVKPALFCSLLLAIMPLAVFYSRNLQPESPAFFFMLLGNLFYLRFAVYFKKRDLLLGGLSFSAAWLYKFSFLMGALPFVFCIPWVTLFREKGKRGFVTRVFIALISYAGILAAVAWLKHIGQWQFEELSRVSPLEIFSRQYWIKYGRMIWWYAQGENFTPVFIATSLAGLFLAAWRRKGLVERYILGWAFVVIPYGMIFSDYINQHNYYQMPFLILVSVASAYSIWLLSLKIKNLLKKEISVFIMAFSLIVSAPLVYGAIYRMFATVFLGTDVAGESLREFTKPNERIFLRTFAQGYGISRYARRYVGWTDDPGDFKIKEKKFDIRYICFYPAELSLDLKARNPGLFQHIQNNYHVKEVGLLESPEKLYYIILERGKGSDPQNFLRNFSGKMQVRAIYKLFGQYLIFNTLRPAE